MSEPTRGSSDSGSGKGGPQVRDGGEQHAPGSTGARVQNGSDDPQNAAIQNGSGRENGSGHGNGSATQKVSAPQSKQPEAVESRESEFATTQTRAADGRTSNQPQVGNSGQGTGPFARPDGRSGGESGRTSDPWDQTTASGPWDRPSSSASADGADASGNGNRSGGSGPPTTSAPSGPVDDASTAAPDVPVWDPPQAPPPRMSLRERLGFGKKSAEPKEDAESADQGDAATDKSELQTPAAEGAGGAVAAAAPGKGVELPTQSGPRDAKLEAPPETRTGSSIEVPAKETQTPDQAQSGDQADAAGQEALNDPDALFRMPSPAGVDTPTELAGTGSLATPPGAAAGPTTDPMPAIAPAPAQPEATPVARPKVGAARRTRKARLRLSRLDPWSVMKTAFLFSIAAGIMLVVAVYAVWSVLETSQLFDSVNEIVKSVVAQPGDTTPFQIQQYINTQKVLGVAALLAVVDVVIFTALATLGSFLYNLAATVLGGLEVTLAED